MAGWIRGPQAPRHCGQHTECPGIRPLNDTDFPKNGLHFSANRIKLIRLPAWLCRLPPDCFHFFISVFPASFSLGSSPFGNSSGDLLPGRASVHTRGSTLGFPGQLRPRVAVKGIGSFRQFTVNWTRLAVPFQLRLVWVCAVSYRIRRVWDGRLWSPLYPVRDGAGVRCGLGRQMGQGLSFG